MLNSIDAESVVGLRDCAIVAVMAFTFPRVTAVVNLKFEDYYAQKKAMAGIENDYQEPLFRTTIGRTGKLSDRPWSRVDAWYMIQRRAGDAKLETSIGCHTFPATGITDYLTNGGNLEIAQRMAGHSDAQNGWPL